MEGSINVEGAWLLPESSLARHCQAPQCQVSSITSLSARPCISIVLCAKTAVGSESEEAHLSTRKEAALMVPQWM